MQSLDSSQQVNKIVQANNEVNCTWVLKYHKYFQLWITVKWPRSYILSLNITIVFMYLRLLGHPRYCVGKWKFKHSDRRLKSLSKNNTLPFYTWKVFEKFRLHELKNVSYSKLKLNTFSPLELFAELSQFLSGATKVSNKITAVEWITIHFLRTGFLPGQVDHHCIIFCLHAQRL